ncbi:MAG: hypothetical protein R3F24_12985 [Gammaproteobacteria bacterium]
MILAIVRTAMLQLWHDRGALLMALLVPVIFFLIFAEIFATAAGDQLQLRVAIVDEVQSGDSIALLHALVAVPSIHPVSGAEPGRLTRSDATDLVRRGTADVGLVVRADGETLATAYGLAAPPLLLFVDPSRSVAATMLSGQLQRAYFSALPDLAIGRVAELIGTELTEFTPAQKAEIDAGLREMRASAAGQSSSGWSFEDLLERKNVAGQSAALNNVAYYAGAVAFMFLLFAAAQGALAILDDQAAGILDRIAAGPGGISGHQRPLSVSLLQGLVQVSLIFAVAWLAYGVDVPGNFAG